MLRKIGMRAHDYGKKSIEELVGNIAGDGYQTIQLALKKAIINVDNIEDGLTKDIAIHTERILYEQNIDISVLGAYLNYGTIDVQARENNVRIFNKHIELAKDFGARLVGTETGSLDVNYKSHENNHKKEGFDMFRSSLEVMADKARTCKVNIGIEPVAHHILHTAKATREMLDCIDSKFVKVIFDPVNIITADNYKQQEYLIKEMFDLVGDSILVVHGKDYVIDQGHKTIVSPGKGLLDYELVTNLIKQSNNEVDLLAENNPIVELHRINNYFNSFFK